MNKKEDDHVEADKKDVGQNPAPPEDTILFDNDKFPVGMRVLAVDDDPVCLRYLEALLKQCQYKATLTTEVSSALKLLREDTNNFDIVITDVGLPHVEDGFKFLEIIGLEMDIPVIMMSAHDDQSIVMKGIEHGACDYLLKPIRLEEIRNIWQHVARKTKLNSNDLKTTKGTKLQPSKLVKRERDQNKEEATGVDSDEHSSLPKRPRIVWSSELHAKFIAAFYELGEVKAVPSKILEKMNVPGLSREKVASHLQKYRNALKKNKQTNDDASKSLDDYLPNVTPMSVDNQRSTGLNYGHGSRLIQIGNHVSNPHSFGSSIFNPKLSSLPMNQRNHLLTPMSLQAFEAMNQTRQRMQFPIPSNSVMMGNPFYHNGLAYQGFPLRQNEYMPTSSHQNFPLLACASNTYPIENSLNFDSLGTMPNSAISTALNNANPQHDPATKEVRNLSTGQNENNNSVNVEMEHINVDSFMLDDQNFMVEDPLDNLEADIIFQHSNSSCDDDLNAAIKQFQQ